MHGTMNIKSVLYVFFKTMEKFFLITSDIFFLSENPVRTANFLYLIMVTGTILKLT